MFQLHALLFVFSFYLCQAEIQFNMPGLDRPLSFNQVSFPPESNILIACNELYFYTLLIKAQSQNHDKNITTKIGELVGVWATKQVLGLVSVIMHELGHAVTSKAGTFYTLKNVEIHYDPLISLLTGAYTGTTYSTYLLESANLSQFHIEKILHCFAGPIAGMASVYLMYRSLIPDFIKKTLMECEADEVPLITYFMLSVLAPHIGSSLPSTSLNFTDNPTDFDQAYDSIIFLMKTT
jgi:hypothetical protein